MNKIPAKTLIAAGAVLAALMAPSSPPVPPGARHPAAPGEPPAPAKTPMKMCVVDELTYGASSRRLRRADAEAEAVAAWRRSAAAALGERYTNYRLAGNASGRCALDDSGMWRCTAQGRPCAEAPDAAAPATEKH
jgi:hypothetical protein